MRCLYDWWKKNTDIPAVALFTKYGNTFLEKLAYAWHTVREVYYYNTSALIVLEGNSFTLSAMKKKKKGVTAVQIWHAAGAFKKFGQDVDRLYPISGLDAVLVSTPNVREIYAHALNVDLERVYAVGIPRTDVWKEEGALEEARKRVLERHPQLAGKKIALYAPTFRGKGIDDIHTAQVNLTCIEKMAPDWKIAVRLHPLMRDQFPDAIHLEKEDLLTALAAADVLITDYSSVLFEYSLLKRPMIFFAPDLENYASERGFYFGYRDFVPGKVVKTEAQLAETLAEEDFESEKIRAFCEQFCYGFDGHATERAGRLIGELAGFWE